MSAMTGPRHSPSSPWPQESTNRQAATASSPTSLLSIRDPNTSPHTTNAPSQTFAPGRSSPNYFAINFENSNNLPDPKQHHHLKQNWDTFAPNQSSIPSPRSHILPQKTMFDDSMDISKNQPGNDKEARDSAAHGFGWNRESQKQEAFSQEKSVHTNYPGQYPRNDKKNSIMKDGSNARPQSFGLLPQNSLNSISRQPSQEHQGQQHTGLFFPYNASRRTSSVVGARVPPTIPPLGHTADGSNGAVSVERCAELLESLGGDVMLLDVRPYAHFAQGKITGALNLCIPTTLLKRPSFNTQKLVNTFTSEDDKLNFARWKHCRYIVVYDAATADMKDALPLLNVLKKFIAEGWSGDGYFLRGGFKAFSSRFPTLVNQRQPQMTSSPKKPTSMHISLPSAAPVAGGCALPESSSVAIPFFGNIRQHMDLVGGVGQIPLQLPERLTESRRQCLPLWLREASDFGDKGRKVSEKFLELEKAELERMHQALSYDKSDDSASTKKFRVAGIEKGTKNRYNDIYPFEHSRVRLQGVPDGGCDYVNGNHMKAEYSHKTYIATQAPVPDTFKDFWRVVWEQDVRLIVSLTAELERGQVKCHPYWETGNYGPLQVKNFSQRQIYMDSPNSHQAGSTLDSPPKGTESAFHERTNENTESPCIIVRHFSLSHSDLPFQPLREITQLQYPHWPDFGTTSQPSHLLRLIEQCDRVSRMTGDVVHSSHDAEPEGQRPVLVHCSAGCGRTGTFCTVDSVLDMLKRQRSSCSGHFPLSTGDGWLNNEKLDLIAKTVADFRTQRPSMIQNLSQFVLCYESVLEWVASQMAEYDGPA